MPERLRVKFWNNVRIIEVIEVISLNKDSNEAGVEKELELDWVVLSVKIKGFRTVEKRVSIASQLDLLKNQNVANSVPFQVCEPIRRSDQV